ncbi:MAG TPA: SDR family oxidoreductase [Fimbriimonadaceae bacterium]|nr:SDR family oxidoreductase [Fimbriimonadaceae bacterium]
MSEAPVLILGATSSIARATANELAVQGHNLYLAGRDLPELWRIASDINIRFGVETNVGVFDIEDTGAHGVFVENALRRVGSFSGVVLAIGDLGSQKEIEKDPGLSAACVARNYGGAVSILLRMANHFEETRMGFVIGISSVAGDRGRLTNYVYGSAKAGLTAFLQGLRARLNKIGVPVLTVKPGFVDTSMTFGRKGMYMLESPENVGRRIVRALMRRRDVVYVPKVWRLIMFVVRSIPERMFKKMKF